MKKRKGFIHRILSVMVLSTMVVNSTYVGIAADERSLTEQIAAAANGSTIVLDRHYLETVTVPQGKDITLDLHGNRLTSTSAYVISNSGTLRIIDTVGGGEIERESVDGDIVGIQNESGGVLRVESGTIIVKTTNSGVATGIKNYGRISEISGGDIRAWTKGSAWAYGLWNEGGTVDNISGGWFYGAILKDHQNGNNGLAVHNASGTVNITGGMFVGTTRSGGSGYGLRTDGNVNISGGTFYGYNGANWDRAVATRNSGAIQYTDGKKLTDNHTGPRTVIGDGQHMVALVDETETPIAAYVLDGNGNIVKSMGHTQSSYNVYISGKTEVVTEADLSRYGGNTVLYVNTGDTREVYMFLGSSVTYGYASNGNSYADYLGDDYGDEMIIRKRAVSGTTLVTSNGNSYVQRMLDEISKNAKIDHLVVQLSTNDATGNKPLGSLSDSYSYSSMNTEEIIGAIEYIISYAYETWGCKVSFWTGPQYDSANYVTMRNALLNQIQPKWGIGVIDFWNLWTPSDGDMGDSIHPKSAGYHKMTPIAYDYLKQYESQRAMKYINEIGNVDALGTCGERIAKARYCYNYTLNSAKAFVTNYGVLERAEQDYAAFFEGIRKVDNATEVIAMSGPENTNNHGAENFDKLFDGKISTKFGNGNYTTPFLWKVEKPIAVKYYSMTTGNDSGVYTGRNPKSWILYGCNDCDNAGNGSWEVISVVNDNNDLPDENYIESMYKVDNPQRYSFYKLVFPSQGDKYMQLSEFAIYEDVNVPEETTTSGHATEAPTTIIMEDKTLATTEIKETTLPGTEYNPGFNPADFTYTTISCAGKEELTLGYAIQMATIEGLSPWYGDDGNTLSLQFSADAGLVSEVTVNGETAGNIVTEIASGLVKVNPTLLLNDAYSVIRVTAVKGEFIVVVKKGNVTGAPTSTTSLEAGDDTTFAEGGETTTLVEEGTTPLEERTTLVEEGTTPLEESTTLAEEGTTPLGESTTLAEEETTGSTYNLGFNLLELTYLKISCEGNENIILEWAVQSTTIAGLVPWYGDGGNTLSLQFAADSGVISEVTVNAEVPVSGLVVEQKPGLVKINPTKLADNAYSVIKVTAENGEFVFVVKRGTPADVPTDISTTLSRGDSDEPTTVPIQSGSDEPITIQTQSSGDEPTTKGTSVTVASTTKAAMIENIFVEKTKVKKLTKKLVAKKAKISLKKIGGVKYQVKISTTKKFKKKKTVTKKVTKAKFTIKSKKIKNKRKLYVKARAYKVVNEKVYYGKWSKVKGVKIKK